MDLSADIVGLGLSACFVGMGFVGALLRWSILRNIEHLDSKLDVANNKADKTSEIVAQLANNLQQLQSVVMTENECTICRKDCQDRLVKTQRGLVESIHRLEDKTEQSIIRVHEKLDNMVMMLANMYNGMGGLNNRSTDKN